MAETVTTDENGRDLTLALSRLARAVRYADLPSDIQLLARLCVLDTISVAFAAVREAPPLLLLDEMRAQGGNPAAGVIGLPDRLPALSAALVNGTLAHAIDYDDVTMTVPGHLSAAIVPALLALGEDRALSGDALLAAFVAGYEFSCRIGVLTSPGHYAAGFHATGTIGALGATVASAHLIGANAAQIAEAIGIATTQTAGLKSMVGTMGKPLHAGRAAYNGLISARLAARGYTARPDSIECDQGFARTHGTDFKPEAALSEPAGAYFLRQNLFKYHAACMITHSPIEAARQLRDEHRIRPDQVAAVTIRVDQTASLVCRYDAPKTALQAKFSLPVAAALALTGRDTGNPDTYSDALAVDPEVNAMRNRVTVDFQKGWALTLAEIDLRLTDGRFLKRRHDSGIPPADVAVPRKLVHAKFLSLATPVIGGSKAGQLADMILHLDQVQNIAALAPLWRPQLE